MRRQLAPVAVAAIMAACGGSSEAEPPPAAAPETTTEADETTSEETTPEETTTEVAPPAPRPRAKPKAPPGVPRFVAGYRGWIKLNAQPIPPRDADPHNGTKNVFVSKRVRADGLFPDGTIVVKEAARPGADFIGLIAVMRKQRGADPEHNDWVFVEYTREAADARFQEIASGAVCWGCHVGAQDRDYVFTLGG